MENDSSIAALLDQYGDVPGGLLPLLHAVQLQLGYVPPEQVPAIANAIEDAIGVRVTTTPFTPETVLDAIDDHRGSR